MMKLSDREWKAFTTNELFSIKSGTTSDFSKLKLSNNSKIPCIGAKYNNNGVVGFANNEELKVKGNSLIFIKTGEGSVGLTIYKEEDFIPHKNVYVGYNANLNKYNGLFIATLYNKQKFIYSYGYGLNRLRVEKRKILLPSKSGKPDYEFMEQYVKEKYFTLKSQIKEKQKHEITDWRGLDEVKWEPFKVADIFNKIQRGKRLTKSDQISGEKPYISSSGNYNGVDNFISNTKNIRQFENSLTLANSGSVGKTFYQPYEFVASDHITHLKSEKLNKYSYLFVANMFNRLESKYSFNREINDFRIKREKILFPTKSNQPDYEFMEQYMKRKENEVLERI
ncbi:restriction endonuclease subunit S [Staphylococcus capitis subsp. urealyticus]